MQHKVEAKYFLDSINDYILSESIGKGVNKSLRIHNVISGDGSLFSEYLVTWKENGNDSIYTTVNLRKAVEKYNELS